MEIKMDKYERQIARDFLMVVTVMAIALFAIKFASDLKEERRSLYNKCMLENKGIPDLSKYCDVWVYEERMKKLKK